MSLGTYVEFGRQTVADYLQQWLDGKVNLKPSTRHGYETHCQLYLVPGLGHLRLSDLRDHHIEELYAAMRQLQPKTAGSKPSPTLRRLLEVRTDVAFRRRPGPSRIRRVHATLMSALNSAVKRGKIARNPAEFVELASGRAPRPVVWTPERVELWRRTGKRYPVAVWTPQQAGAFLDYVSRDGLAALWQLAADCATTALARQSNVSRGARRGSSPDLSSPKDDGSPLNPNGVSQRFERLIADPGCRRYGSTTCGMSPPAWPSRPAYR